MEHIRAAKCFHGNMQYKPGGPVNLSGGKKPPKYFELKKTAEKFLANRNSDVFKELLLNQQQKIKELVKRVGLKLDAALKERGLSNLAAFSPANAQKYIEELDKQYSEGKRKGPEVRPDVRVGRDEAGEEQGAA